MARTYNVIRGYGEKPDSKIDMLSSVPVAVIAVWRYKTPVTFSRKNQASIDDNEAATNLRDEVLIICDDIEAMNVHSGKESHISTLQTQLYPNYNYLAEVFPGDWVLAWIVNGIDAAKSLIDDIRNGQTCNGPNSGFKFLGRALSMRKVMRTDSNGRKNETYALTAGGGLEWDSSVYYEPALEQTQEGLASEWLKKTGVAINDIIIDGKTAADGGIATSKAIPRLMDAFFGSGVPKNEGAISTDGSADSTAGLDSADVFLVPPEVAAVLGIASGTKNSGKIGINDITEVLIGLQTYESLDTEDIGKLLYPSNASSDSTVQVQNNDGATESRRSKCDDLLGLFLPSPPQFNGQHSVWQITSQFVNDAVNEMYLTLRPNSAGRILPTLVVRQLPFSSGLISSEFKPKALEVVTEVPTTSTRNVKDDEKDFTKIDFTSEGTDIQFVNQNHQVKLTRFTEIPRWQVPEIMVQNLDVGRNDALRFNFIHVYASTGEETSQDRTAYIVRDKPVRDEIDIARNGLRMYPRSISCSPADAVNRKAADWMYILSDILMGQHMTLTGTLSSFGIYSPICVGDNLEYDQTIFHIEGVNHTFTFDGTSGRRSFHTSVALTHGVRVQQMAGDDASLYTGSDPKDLTRNDAAHGGDEQFSPTKKAGTPQKTNDFEALDLTDA